MSISPIPSPSAFLPPSPNAQTSTPIPPHATDVIVQEQAKEQFEELQRMVRSFECSILKKHHILDKQALRPEDILKDLISSKHSMMVKHFIKTLDHDAQLLTECLETVKTDPKFHELLKNTISSIEEGCLIIANQLQDLGISSEELEAIFHKTAHLIQNIKDTHIQMRGSIEENTYEDDVYNEALLFNVPVTAQNCLPGKAKEHLTAAQTQSPSTLQNLAKEETRHVYDRIADCFATRLGLRRGDHAQMRKLKESAEKLQQKLPELHLALSSSGLVDTLSDPTDIHSSCITQELRNILNEILSPSIPKQNETQPVVEKQETPAENDAAPIASEEEAQAQAQAPIASEEEAQGPTSAASEEENTTPISIASEEISHSETAPLTLHQA